MEANEAAIPTAIGAAAGAGRPAPARRPPFSSGRADDDRQRDRAREQVRLVAREAPPARGRQRGAVARDPGRQRRRLGEAERQPVDARPPRRARAAAAGCRRPASAPRRPAARPRSPAARRAVARSAARARSRPTAAGAKERARTAARRASKARSSLAIRRALADQQRRRGAGVQRDLEALAQLRVEPVPVPAGEPGDEDDVGGAGDRQQLGRTLDQSERDGAPGRDPRRPGPAQVPPARAASAVSLARPPPPRRR